MINCYKDLQMQTNHHPCSMKSDSARTFLAGALSVYEVRSHNRGRRVRWKLPPADRLVGDRQLAQPDRLMPDGLADCSQ